MNPIDGGTGNIWCREHSEDLVLYLYDELSPEGRAAVEGHLASCAACRAEIDSTREALQTVDAAHLREMATFGLPVWSDVEDEVAAALPPIPIPARPRRLAIFARAASIVLIAGAAFVAGRQWDTLGNLTANGTRSALPADSVAGSQIPPLPAAATAGDRLRAFSERTHGYFQRSRLVLLEFANADQVSDGTMRAASRNLLRETAAARQVAGQIHDERIQDLVAALEEILTRIASNDTNGDERAALRADVEDLLGRLELSTTPDRVAQGRTRT